MDYGELFFLIIYLFCQGKPLLGQDPSGETSPIWLNHKTVGALMDQNLELNCAVLGLSETGVPQFVLNIG